MNKPRKASVGVKGTAITILVQHEQDYISLTDIARHRNPDHTDDLIRNWLRNRNTIEFLGIWESLNNPGFKRQAGLCQPMPAEDRLPPDRCRQKVDTSELVTIDNV